MARVDFKDMIQFADEVVVQRKLFEGLEMEPLETYLGVDTRPAWEFKTPLANGFYKPFVLKGSDKIEKITYGELHYMGRVKYCALNFTCSDDYDLPVMACEFDESAPRLSITLDFMPLVDIAVYPEYREKYLVPLGNLWRKYRSIPGFTKDGRCLVQRRYAPWPWARATLSPYPIDGRVEEPEDRISVLDAVVDYARVWLEMMKKAEPIRDPVYKQEMLTRKRALQKYYRDLDPGGEVLKKLFGEEKMKLFVSLIF
ncbi:MAG: hypothetical protein NTX06_13515 [Proteobacteria bacterium]|nr:hypothetical protein [Pseudomonadota bacterium]